MISAKEVVNQEKKKSAVRKEYYKALLEQFSRKIKNRSELGFREALLTVPPFLVGWPKYDLATTVSYMCRQLSRLGYNVQLAGPLDIRVQWHHKKVEEEKELEVQDPNTYLPSLANLQKTAQKLRVKKVVN
jgi:hypothetical protein